MGTEVSVRGSVRHRLAAAARPSARRVLVPILGSSYGEALEGGDIELRYDAAEGSFSAWYYEHRLPIGPSRYGEILQKVVADAGASRNAGRPASFLNSPRDIAARTIPRATRRQRFKAELAAVAGGERYHRPRAARLSAEVRRSRSGARPASPARAPALPAGALAAGRQRDQLSPFLRHQFAGRPCGSRTPPPFTPSTPWSAA